MRVLLATCPVSALIRLLAVLGRLETHGPIGIDKLSITTAMLERRCPPHLALFSYFPADRAFPTGEVNVQIGSAEAFKFSHTSGKPLSSTSALNKQS